VRPHLQDHAHSGNAARHGPFLSGFFLRGLFMTGCIAALMLLWSAINPAPSADGQRAITPRGNLAADEQATIALFERARGSVVSISTRQYVEDVDPQCLCRTAGDRFGHYLG
jgi:hypothetical protein